jgi:hypothetical protein
MGLGNRKSDRPFKMSSELGYHWKRDVPLYEDKCPSCDTLYHRRPRDFGLDCPECSAKKRGEVLHTKIREHHPRWKSDYKRIKSGYYFIRLYPDNPYFSMAHKRDRWCMLHRYIYATEVAHRPLEKWEVVHHKGTKYPQGSYEDKGYNRLDNLEYCVNQATHNVYSFMSKEINSLRKQNAELEKENIELKIKIKQIKLINKSGVKEQNEEEIADRVAVENDRGLMLVA